MILLEWYYGNAILNNKKFAFHNAFHANVSVLKGRKCIAKYLHDYLTDASPEKELRALLIFVWLQAIIFKIQIHRLSYDINETITAVSCFENKYYFKIAKEIKY